VADRFVVWLGRDVVAARGAEAGTFLQGQLSQDVLSLATGDSAWSWLLSPQGKVDALVRVTRRSDDEWLLDTDGGWGQAVLTRLNRFKLRTKVEFEVMPWRCLGWRGEGMNEVPGDAVATRLEWPLLDGVDCFGPDLAVPDGWTVMDDSSYEARRIVAGMPRMGAELTDKTIPAETGLVARTVSFTKGCYTGQELVARIDSRGSNVPRRLRLLTSTEQVAPGAELVDGEGKVAGSVTSAARGSDGFVALGYVRRNVEVPGCVRAGDVELTVGELPA
jgi:folate-binding protein YgfZ